jgi:hypothetical protein
MPRRVATLAVETTDLDVRTVPHKRHTHLPPKVDRRPPIGLLAPCEVVLVHRPFGRVPAPVERLSDHLDYLAASHEFHLTMVR